MRQIKGLSGGRPIATNDTGKYSIDTDIIPQNQAIAYLAQFRHWVGYRLEAQPNGQAKKIPINPFTGENAASDKPDTWATYRQASAAVPRFNLTGLGFVLTQGCGIVGGDIDRCLNKGILSDFAQQTVYTLRKTYWELSPSGQGLRFFALGSLPHGRRKDSRLGFEIYDSGRFLTITGHHLPGTATQITPQNEAIAALYAHIFGGLDQPAPDPIERPDSGNHLTDADLLAKAINAKNGEKFLRLWNGDTSHYPSPSEADQALVNLLCFWTNFDAERIDRLFRQSALMRDKWNRADYRQLTINKAFEIVKHGYRGINLNTNQADALADRLIRWATSRQWKGRTGLVDKAVYLAHLSTVKRIGKTIYQASVRELAEMTGHHWTTANRANKRLSVMGLIVVTRNATFTMPTQFELVDITNEEIFQSVSKCIQPCDNGMYPFETTNQPDCQNSQDSLIVCSILKQNSDLWRHRGLGKTGLDIYTTLLQAGKSLTQAEVVELTGRSKATVSRKLNALIDVGMVATDFGRYEAIHVENEPGIAKLVGTFGAGEKQKRQHQLERQAHKQSLKARQRISNGMSRNTNDS